MKKLLSVLSILLFFMLFIYGYDKNNIIVDEFMSNKYNDMLSMMIETNTGSGIYEESKNSLWPQDGYVFNEKLSKCENGSNLTWDDVTKEVMMKGNISDKCYVYFDVKKVLLVDYVKSLYTSQGANGLYLHDNTLANGANDGSYRYAGANPNNYVCFGTDVSPCPLDNQYRIIGVFEGQIKLIKSTEATVETLGTDGVGFSDNRFFWSQHYRLWNESLLNIVNLNKNYIDSIGVSWSDKISVTNWCANSSEYIDIANVVVADSYKNEIISPRYSSTYNAKIGLMYVSDYGFAADPSAWLTILSNYGKSEIMSNNWLSAGKLGEWSITSSSDENFDAFRLEGSVDISLKDNLSYVRPTFYLNSNVIYVSGDGTQANPYRIN